MSSNEDTIRVLRILEYVGSRSIVEEHLRRAVHERVVRREGKQMTIRGTTLGLFPDILEEPEPER